VSRPLPRCAWCGSSLARRGRMLIRWTAVPGTPAIAWCLPSPDDGGGAPGCSADRDDPLYPWPRGGVPREMHPELLIPEIAGRGADRVTASPAWSTQAGRPRMAANDA